MPQRKQLLNTLLLLSLPLIVFLQPSWGAKDPQNVARLCELTIKNVSTDHVTFGSTDLIIAHVNGKTEVYEKESLKLRPDIHAGIIDGNGSMLMLLVHDQGQFSILSKFNQNEKSSSWAPHRNVSPQLQLFLKLNGKKIKEIYTTYNKDEDYGVLILEMDKKLAVAVSLTADQHRGLDVVSHLISTEALFGEEVFVGLTQSPYSIQYLTYLGGPGITQEELDRANFQIDEIWASSSVGYAAELSSHHSIPIILAGETTNILLPTNKGFALLNPNGDLTLQPFDLGDPSLLKDFDFSFINGVQVGDRVVVLNKHYDLRVINLQKSLKSHSTKYMNSQPTFSGDALKHLNSRSHPHRFVDMTPISDDKFAIYLYSDIAERVEGQTRPHRYRIFKGLIFELVGEQRNLVRFVEDLPEFHIDFQ